MQFAEIIRQTIRPDRVKRGLVIRWLRPNDNQWCECSYATEVERDAMLAQCARKGYRTETVNF